MEGRQPNRHGESLTHRQKRVFAVVSAAVLVALAAVGAWAAATPGSYGRSHDGCINVTVPSSTGGAVVHQCGARARATCQRAVAGHDQFSRLAQPQCRLAGLAGGSTPAG